MNYQQTISYLYALQPPFHMVGSKAYKPGLKNTELLMERLGHPERKFLAIHVTGTNGKGSTSHLLAACLQSAGLKVGLYTSPHLVDFRERIRITRSTEEPMQIIEEERVVSFVEANRAFLEEVKPSFFETTMALAFQYFAEQQIDVAVIEVGLGGRLDSTNILPAYTQAERPYGVLLSVITNIGMDHTEFLGNTLSAIASEKAGIIKPGVPCVVGESHPETDSVFMDAARQNGILGSGLEREDCYLWFADRCMFLARERQRTVGSCQLTGDYQQKNMQTVFVALRALMLMRDRLPSCTLDHEAISKGFAQVVTLTGLRGRWEVLRTAPMIVCDTGHNSHGIRYVVSQLNRLYAEHRRLCANARLRIVFGMVDDKDVDVVIGMMPRDAMYYLTQAGTHRAIPAQRLLHLWKEQVEDVDAACFADVTEAVQAAVKDQQPNDIVFIGGSNYVVGEALRLFTVLCPADAE